MLWVASRLRSCACCSFGVSGPILEPATGEPPAPTPPDVVADGLPPSPVEASLPGERIGGVGALPPIPEAAPGLFGLVREPVALGEAGRGELGFPVKGSVPPLPAEPTPGAAPPVDPAPTPLPVPPTAPPPTEPAPPAAPPPAEPPPPLPPPPPPPPPPPCASAAAPRARDRTRIASERVA